MKQNIVLCQQKEILKKKLTFKFLILQMKSIL